MQLIARASTERATHIRAPEYRCVGTVFACQHTLQRSPRQRACKTRMAQRPGDVFVDIGCRGLSNGALSANQNGRGCWGSKGAGADIMASWQLARQGVGPDSGIAHTRPLRSRRGPLMPGPVRWMALCVDALRSDSVWRFASKNENEGGTVADEWLRESCWGPMAKTKAKAGETPKSGRG
jgi:hypothetical protein